MLETSLIWESKKDKILGFKYLWLKTVTGFNPAVHCARCLIGKYSDIFSPKIEVNTKIVLPYHSKTILYFCGVTDPYRWKKNLHLVGFVMEGKSTKVEVSNGDNLVVNNFKRIEIEEAFAKSKYPNKSSSFLTCRNYQFGSNLEEYLRIIN